MSVNSETKAETRENDLKNKSSNNASSMTSTVLSLRVFFGCIQLVILMQNYGFNRSSMIAQSISVFIIIMDISGILLLSKNKNKSLFDKIFLWYSRILILFGIIAMTSFTVRSKLQYTMQTIFIILHIAVTYSL